ncbi:uncharacterized protein LOC100275106 [Zea mays]|jgi:hypothetical protein|nr:uncharacterized protein LOC100275106 [Zea mays]
MADIVQGVELVGGVRRRVRGEVQRRAAPGAQDRARPGRRRWPLLRLAS